MLSAGEEKGRELLVRLGYDRFRHGSHGSSVMKLWLRFKVSNEPHISVFVIGENETRTASEIHYGRIDDA